MEWPEYKRLCERPDHFSRWALQLTSASVADPAARSALSQVLLGTPLTKPQGHHGGPETDYFRVDVALQHVGAIVAHLGAAAARAAGKAQRRLTHLKVVWQEYAAFLSGC